MQRCMYVFKYNENNHILNFLKSHCLFETSAHVACHLQHLISSLLWFVSNENT